MHCRIIERSYALRTTMKKDFLGALKGAPACRQASYVVWLIAAGLTCALLVGVITLSWWTLLEYLTCGLPVGLTVGSRIEPDPDGLLLNPRFHASWLVVFEKKVMKTLNMAAVGALWIIVSPLFLWVSRNEGRPPSLKRGARKLAAFAKMVIDLRSSWFRFELQQ
jgi:hypothetical protein